MGREDVSRRRGGEREDLDLMRRVDHIGGHNPEGGMMSYWLASEQEETFGEHLHLPEVHPRQLLTVTSVFLNALRKPHFFTAWEPRTEGLNS